MSETQKLKRVCYVCGAVYWNDGYSTCTDCDVADTIKMQAHARGMLPDAPERLRRMREEGQARVAEQAAKEGL